MEETGLEKLGEQTFGGGATSTLQIMGLLFWLAMVPLSDFSLWTNQLVAIVSGLRCSVEWKDSEPTLVFFSGDQTNF